MSGWCPFVPSLPARAALKMCIFRRNSNLFNETGTESLDRPSGRLIIRVAGNDYFLVKRADKGRKRATSLKRIAVPSKFLFDLKPNVSSEQQDVLGMTDSQVDVPNLRAVESHDPEMIGRRETASNVTRQNPYEEK
jgi:hypothetical protein